MFVLLLLYYLSYAIEEHKQSDSDWLKIRQFPMIKITINYLCACKKNRKQRTNIFI